MIYIHVPFCRSFCTYCDFYSEIACKGRDAAQIAAYTDSLCREIASRRSEIEPTLSTNTLYIGGGTPSVLPLGVLEQIVSEIGIKSYDEFTIEVNPDDINSIEYVRGLKNLGVNRISMGVQSFDDQILKWMNRRHDSASALRAYGLLGSEFENISLDLIFGLSNMGMDTLEGSLRQAVSLRPKHISAYQLSIESGSALGKMVEEGRYVECADGLCEEQYALICKYLADAGYRHYEISSWALPGFEAVHNAAYWSREKYVGFGPGAHSFDGACRSWNSEELCDWIRNFEILSSLEAREEEIMLGLRTAKGVAANLLDSNVLDVMIGQGLLLRSGDRVRIPECRFFVSDDIISQLI